jgi:hypothetical protein
MAVGDKFVITMSAHQGDDLENTFNNVFAYVGQSGSPNAADLATTFNSGVVTAICDALSSTMLIDTVTVINLDNTTDFFILNSGLGGVLGGEAEPRFVAWEFEYLHADRAVHSGRKSFGAIPTDQVVGNAASVSAVGAILDPLAATLADVLDGGSASEYAPMIWRRAGTYLVAGVPTAFPDTFYPITTVLYRRVSTQNTRKK